MKYLTKEGDEMKTLSLVDGVVLGLSTVTAYAQQLTKCSGVSMNCARMARLVQKMIRIYGWRCDNVSAVTKFAFSRGFHVYCNNFNYGYDIKDRGGNWVVTLK